MEVKPNIPFHPFEGLDEWYSVEQRRSDPKIEDDYQILYLRRKIIYKGIEGFIDLVDEDSGYLGYDQVTRIADAGFVLEESEEDQEGPIKGLKVTDEIENPLVVRMVFFLKNPRDLMSLINTNIQLLTDKGNFLLLYQVDVGERKYLEELELEGMKTLVRDGYSKVTELDGNVSRIIKADRVWFPVNDDEIDKIKVVFQVDENKRDDDEEPEPPEPPVEERELIRV